MSICNAWSAKGIIEVDFQNQHHRFFDEIKKDLNIICFNQNQLVGNGLILPAGPLRENLSSLLNANIVLINGKKDQDFEEKILKINKNLEI